MDKTRNCTFLSLDLTLCIGFYLLSGVPYVEIGLIKSLTEWHPKRYLFLGKRSYGDKEVCKYGDSG